MKNLYIDFDGVILNTNESIDKLFKGLNIERGSAEGKELTRNLDWTNLIEDADQINNSIKNIHKIMKSEKFNVYILTHVVTINEIVAKVKYIRKYMDYITVIPVPKEISKTEIVRATDAILIDDYSGNLEEWENAGGIGVRFTLDLTDDKGYPVIDSLEKIINLELE